MLRTRHNIRVGALLGCMLCVALTAASILAQPGELPTIESFTSDESTVLIGAGTTLRFTVSNSEQVTIDPTGVVTSSQVGTINVGPSATTTYVLTASNPVGSVSAELTVTVLQFEIRSFQATRTILGSTESTVLSWEVYGSGAVTLSGHGPQALSGELEVQPVESIQYELSVRNGEQFDRRVLNIYVGEYETSTLGLSWSADAYRTVAPPMPHLSPVFVHVLGISLDHDIAGCEFHLDVPDGIQVSSVSYPSANAVNVGTNGDYIVGLGTCISDLNELVLIATFELIATDVSDLENKFLSLTAVSNPSIPGNLSYAGCMNELTPIAAGFPLPLSGEGASIPVLDLDVRASWFGEAALLEWSLPAGLTVDRFEIWRMIEGSPARHLASIAAAQRRERWEYRDEALRADLAASYRRRS